MFRIRQSAHHRALHGPAQRVATAALVLLFFAFICAGCNEKNNARGAPRGSGDRYRVVTTTAMVADIVRQVAGDKAEVVGLLGEGVDPHLYRPTPSDVKKLIAADVVIYNGLMLEGRMQEAFEKVKKSGRPVYAVADVIDQSKLIAPPEFEGHYDPHVWMDVAMWSQCVGYVAEKLGEFDPPNAAYYAENAEKYRAELGKLDQYVRDVIASIPEQQRVLVTAHDAFGYFSRAYNIPVRSAQGVSTESEPGINDINQLVDFLVENQIGAIFVETSVSESNLSAVVEGAANQRWKVKIGGSLFSDAMGASGTYEGTYVGMIDHNATLIARSLGGEAPQRGMNAKLSSIR